MRDVNQFPEQYFRKIPNSVRRILAATLGLYCAWMEYELLTNSVFGQYLNKFWSRFSQGNAGFDDYLGLFFVLDVIGVVLGGIGMAYLLWPRETSLQTQDSGVQMDSSSTVRRVRSVRRRRGDVRPHSRTRLAA